MNSFRRPSVLVAVVSALLAVVSLVALERQRIGLVVERTTLAGSPATIWRDPGIEAPPLVIIAHGYAGSRQMMQPIAMTLARQGHLAVAFDFHGHGRHPVPMSGDVTSLDGVTEQLVRQTVAVTEAARQLPGATGPVALVGHSMATDIVIRAADRIDAAAVVAISMYSDAVTGTFPERLLILSGAREGRLREVALDRLRLVDPEAAEGETARQGDVVRRVAVAPWVGHVGVLYSPTTRAEIRDWVTSPRPSDETAAAPMTGAWLFLLLTAQVALGAAAATALGPRQPTDALPMRRILLAVGAPVAPALLAALVVPPGWLGLAAFGPLAIFFAVWGGVQLALARPGRAAFAFAPAGFALLLGWGLGLFAPALDRYGAAFVPVGPRLTVMALLLAGTVPFAVADAILLRGARWPLRLLARAVPIAVLLGAMLIAPRLGTAFTVLPVIVLFWVVYGTVGGRVAARTGPLAAGLALGIILAWAIAASTPLLAA
jgi:hypothetical protein